ncbi:MAG: type III secretion system stator protein SctL [Proteobacteria bacterium]|nr:type III secretion system stator protein SctL [Cystobacterineae bacterium]MCL2258760.1 type III secretion system stator protein SctL [Cystobacterineae bacterium]MCL2314379.1 type III secretion system stator protein SctL [Pseudomonadota bacterium]
MADTDNKGPPRSLGKIIREDLASGASGLESIASPRFPPSIQGRPPMPSRLVPFEEVKARSKAKDIVEEAQQKAQELLEEAERQREFIFQEARKEAFAEVTTQAATELAKAKMQVGMMLAEAEPELIELACRIAEKIIGRDLERNPKLLLEICANAIENLRTSKAMLLRVHPKDAKLLRENRAELIEFIGRSVDIAIRDDAEVQPGGCVVQTEFGVIDAQLDTQFKALRTLFEANASGKAD